MLALTPHLRIFVAFDPIDFRCGMNRLAQIAKDLFSEDPQSGVLFVFRNRRQSEVKMLVYDGSGYYLIHRRLSSGRLAFWPKTLLQQKEPGITVESSELLVLLRGGDPRGTLPESWKKVEANGFEKKSSSRPKRDRDSTTRRASAHGPTDHERCGAFAKNPGSVFNPAPAPS